MHELRLALQVDAALQVDVLGSPKKIEELNPLARSRPVDCCPEQLEVVVVEHEVPPDQIKWLQLFILHIRT